MPDFPLKEYKSPDNRDVRNDKHERNPARHTFQFTFTVRASITEVAQFHGDTNTLRRLTPPPIWVQFHSVEPISEGSLSDFTLWFAVIPLRWKARHDKIDALHGFRDTQVEGPMLRWEHTHSFTEESTTVTRISEHIVYEHAKGVQGLFTRLLFNSLGLKMNFLYRCVITRRLLERGV